MRMPLAEPWIEALDDEQRAVRSFALMMVSKEASPPPDALRRVMAQIDRHGWEDAYEFSHEIGDFPLDGSSIDWAADRMIRAMQTPPAKDDGSLRFLLAWFCSAPPELLESRIGRVSAALEAYRQPAGEPEWLSLEPARERLQLAAATPAELVEALEECIAKCSVAFDESPWDEAARLERICEAVGNRGAIPPEILEKWLEVDPDADPDEAEPDADWRAIAAVEIFRHGKAPLPVDALILWLTLDWDLMNEKVAEAFCTRADEADAARIVEHYPTLDWAGRLYLTSVLERVRFASLEPAIRELARKERAVDLKLDLAATLVLYGSRESVDAARGIPLWNATKGDQEELKEMLMVHDWLAGDRSAEAVRQMEERDRNAQRLRKMSAEIYRSELGASEPAESSRVLSMVDYMLPQTGKNSQPDVGRNDPCPCGSGRKFKKCCGG